MKNPLETVLRILITLAVPLILWVGAIRLLLTPAFVNVEYNLPQFPEDRYGFSKAERLQYAHRARRFLVRDYNIEYLGELEFEDGSPLFIARELRHMKDVKQVLQAAFTAFWFSAVVLVGGVIWAWQAQRWGALLSALSRGGWLTLILIFGILFLTLLNFRAFFVVFHRIFFSGNTWVFRYSDTLIRLFPIRFWQDAFLAFGVLSAGSALGLGLLGRKVKPAQGGQVD